MVRETSQAAESKARAELFVLSGADVGRSFEIVHGSSVGRAPDRAVVLRDRSISRHHAHFECAQGTWSIVDDGSTNGFAVDGARRERAELTDLREFLIGEVLVRLRTQITDAPLSQSPPPVAPPARPAPEDRSGDGIVIEDEILLDSAPEATRPTLASPPARASALAGIPAPPTPLARAAAVLSGGDPALATRGRRILQFHKQDARQGFFVTDLAQRPLWVRLIACAFALAIAAALAWGAYRGVLSMREDLSGESEPSEVGG